MKHPIQLDGCSCGVIVLMMAKAVMEAFPELPKMEFGKSKKHMAQERRALALKILEASVFDAQNNCSMCAASKPPSPGPSMTDWIQWDSCTRWFHAVCVPLNKVQFEQAKNTAWDCCLCD
ncbi:lysine-specific demethylase 5B-B-like [Chanodichthys erythropterus]